MEEKTIESTYIYRGKILNLRVDKVVLPSGKIHHREILEHGESVAILPLHGDKILLIKQFRKPLDREIWEVPAGRREKGEDIHECARRELEEETGMEARKLVKVGEYLPSPGYSTELIHLFIGEELVEGRMHPEEDEFIQRRFFSPEEIRIMIKKGDITDGKTLALLFHFLMKK